MICFEQCAIDFYTIILYYMCTDMLTVRSMKNLCCFWGFMLVVHCSIMESSIKCSKNLLNSFRNIMVEKKISVSAERIINEKDFAHLSTYPPA